MRLTFVVFTYARCFRALLEGFPNVRVIAHRGASARAPENTLTAFRSALEAGAVIERGVDLVCYRELALGSLTRRSGSGGRRQPDSFWDRAAARIWPLHRRAAHGRPSA